MKPSALVCLGLCLAVHLVGCAEQPDDFDQSTSAPGVAPFAFDRTHLSRPAPIRLEAAKALVRPRLAANDAIDGITIMDLEESNQQLIQATAVSRSGSETRFFALDGAGVVVTPRDMLRAEAIAHQRRLGRFTRELFDWLQGSDTGTVRVDVWVETDGALDFDLDQTLSFDSALAAHRARIRNAISGKKAEAISLLSDLGATDIDLQANQPVVRATLSRAALHSQALHTSRRIAMIGKPTRLDGPLHHWRGYRAMRGPISGGSCGSGTQCLGLRYTTSIYEYDGHPGLIQPLNPKLRGAVTATYQQPAKTCMDDEDCPCGFNQPGPCGTCNDNNKCVAEHSTLVAGSIGQYGNYTDSQGMTWTHAGAPEYNMLVANNIDTDPINWSIEHSAIYMVRGQTLDKDPNTIENRKLDWHARYSFLFFAMASGNSSSQTVECGNYNGLCVGAYNYGSSLASNGDDRVAPFSQYRNPASGRELPHLVAPGIRLHTASICPGHNGQWVSFVECIKRIGIQGTSLAAPAALGIAQIVQQYGNTFTMATSVLRKAIVLTATRDANGDGAISIGGPFDGKDGAGAPDLIAAKRMIDSSTWRLLSVKQPNFDANGYHTVTWPVTVPAGRSLRVGLAWNSCPSSIGSGSGATNTVRTDFDIQVDRPIGPNGMIVGRCGYNPCSPGVSCPLRAGGSVWSQTVPNEYEMIQDDCLRTSSTAGTFVIRLRYKKSTGFNLCNSDSRERVALAWDIVP